MRFILIFGSIYLLFISLSCENVKPATPKIIKVKPCLIHPLFFQDEIASLINFPFWFNDSLVKAQKIESLSITTYGSVKDTDEDEANEQFPKKTVRYTFDRLGHVIHIQSTDYFEGIIISHQSFQLIKSKFVPYYGVKRLDNAYGVANSTYLIHLNKLKKHVTQYDNDVRGERLHYIANSNFWGALSVDSIAHAKPTDWIILGTPEKPEKRYRVKNTVTEQNVTHYSYLNKNFPSATINEDYPFTRKRRYVYSPSGHFNGFVDSTFIDDAFVTRTIHTIQYDSAGKPIKLLHKKGHAEGNMQYISKEIISYTFF